MKETLKSMKDTLAMKAMEQMSCLEQVDAKELGEVIDMVKDLEEALYYCAVTEAMEGAAEKEKEQEMRISNNTYYYTEPRDRYGYDYYRDMDRPYGKMYYGGDGGSGTGRMSSTGSVSQDTARDSREGRSPTSRRQYMESKELHLDKSKQLKDLEKYMQELTSDIAEMIEDASPEEKQLLQKKISALATKVDQMK